MSGGEAILDALPSIALEAGQFVGVDLTLACKGITPEAGRLGSDRNGSLPLRPASGR